MANESSVKTVKSIVKAIDILKAISLDRKRLKDISQEVSLNVSTVHRLVNTLKKCGLVIQNPTTGEYLMGPLLVELASNPLKEHQYFIHASSEPMEKLHSVSNETISLDIMSGMTKMKLKELLSKYSISYMDKKYNKDYTWAGATGKALLSLLDERELEKVLHFFQLIPLTQNTITDRALFKQEIIKTKELRFATSISETELGVVAVAAPIAKYTVPASIAIIGPEDRMTPRLKEFSEEIKIAAASISESISKYL